MDREKLPDNLKDRLERDFPGEEVLIALSSDITVRGLYGEEWLVVVGGKLFVFSVEGEEEKVIWDFALDSVRKVEAVNLVGSGVLEVDSGERVFRVISYSDAKNADFSQAAEDIGDLLQGKPFSGKKRESHRKLCDRCSRPIPRDMIRCPRCTERRKTLFRTLAFTRPHAKLMALLFLTMVLGTAFGLVAPWMSKEFIDTIFMKAADGSFPNARWLPHACLVLLGAYGAQLLLEGFRERLSGYIGFRTVYEIRGAIYEKLQELSLSFFDRHHSGAMLSRVSQDTGELQTFLVEFLPLTLESAFVLVGVGALLLVLSPTLTMYVIIPIILTVFFLIKIFPRVHTYFHRFFQRRSRLTAQVSDSLSGMRVIKAFGQEASEVEKFDAKSASYRDAGMELVRKWSVYHPVLHFLIMCGVVIVWFVGGKQAFAGKMTLGEVVAYSGYLMMFYRPVFMLSRMARRVWHALSAAERVFDVMDTEVEIADAPDAVAAPGIEGKIEFKNVTFGYNKFDPVIRDLSVTIQANEMVGLVGRSGAGKSTISNLVCRLYDVDRGQVLVDGVDVRKMRYSDLRHQIGVVLQETFLFNGSIADNIGYAKPGAGREEIIEAAGAAHAHEFIIAKPDGYDTEVGERGNRLSEGEKQRISIARAILRDNRILILDEATSSVDTQTEKMIQDALVNLTRGRTTIAIAHRLSTLRNCNRLLVIQEGRLAEAGTHEELMEKKGIFHKLVTMQQEMSKMKAVDG